MQAFMPENVFLFERYYFYLKILPCFVFDGSELLDSGSQLTC